LVEAHSRQLSDELQQKLLKSDRCSTMRLVPPEELHERSFEIYRNLGSWLLNPTDKEVESRYTEIGATRAGQGVELSHVVYGLLLTKEHLLEYLERESFYDSSLAVFAHLELLRKLDQFYDRAIYFAVVGYEQAIATKEQAA
jgi:hypothetical protein